MHVLTKIFVVLVSLLAVLLVPLVVVYAYNENSYEKLYQEAQARATAARADLNAATASFQANELGKASEIQEYAAANSALQTQVDRQMTDVRRLESDLAAAESGTEEINAKLALLAQSVESGQMLTSSLIDELRTIRSEALGAERRRVELDERLRDVQAKLDVAVEARRALEEQLQRTTDDLARATNTIAAYVAKYPPIDPGTVAVGSRINLDATIVHVSRTNDGQDLAEINAGSRDGVEVGMELIVGRDGQYLATLRIVNVDINRSTGVIESEDPETRGTVEVGDAAYARAGS